LSADIRNPSEYRSGVGIVLCNPRGLIFNGKRRDRRDPPWQMPQGGIQAGETPEQAALRELGEELGIADVTLVERSNEWTYYDYPDAATSRRAVNFRGQRHLWFLLRYDGDDDAIKIDAPHGEFIDWRWRSAAETVDRVIGFKQAVYRQVMRHFADAIDRIGAGASADQTWSGPLRLRRIGS